jgi:hypothetical protein
MVAHAYASFDIVIEWYNWELADTLNARRKLKWKGFSRGTVVESRTLTSVGGGE